MKIRNIQCSILAVVLLHVLALDARAFECGLGPTGFGHQTITEQAADRLKNYNPLVWGITKSKLDTIQSINWKIDGLVKFAEQTDPKYSDVILSPQLVDWYHFDDECFHAGSQKLIEYKKAIIEGMLDGSTATTDRNLSFALHLLQDFYSHTDFIELGNYDGQIVRNDQGESILGNFIIDVPKSGWANQNRTCTETFHQICFCGIIGACWNCPFWNCGDLCSCGCTTKWWTDNETEWEPNLRSLGYPKGLTSGWAWNSVKQHPNHKVNHTGLNKDTYWSIRGGWDNGEGHRRAFRSAVNATEEYLRQILDDPRIRTNRAALSVLMDNLGQLDIVCDNSRDMAPHFAAVMDSVRNVVLNDHGVPTSYLLQLFDYDPVPRSRITVSRDRFLQWLNDSRISSREGPCPKAAFRALLNAVAAAHEHEQGTLFFFSNASADDATIARDLQIRQLAAQKQIRIVWCMLPNICPINDVTNMYVPADKLGGQVLRLTADTVANIAPLLRSEVSGTVRPLLSVCGTLATNTVKEFTVPIDSTVTNVTFMISVETNSLGTNAAVAITDPHGTNITESAGITIWELGTGRGATVAQPEPGAWVIRFQGEGHYSVNVNGATPVQLSRFAFADALDGQEAYPAIPGQPTQVTNAVSALLLGSYTNLSFSLATPGGDFIQSFAMAPYTVTNLPTNGLDGVYYTGTVALPSQPFKVVVTGSDTNGFAFQRTYPSIFQLQPVEVRSLQTSLLPITPGVPYHVRYLVSNFGTNDVFQVDLAATRAIVTNLWPTSFALPPGGTNVVEADLLLPPGTNLTTLECVTAVVVSTNDPSIHNGAVDEFSIGPAYVGNITIVSSNTPVTLSLTNAELITNGPAGGNLVLVGGTSTATLDLNGSFETINGLVSQGVEANARVTSDSDATLIVGDADATATFGGQIMNAVELVKIGNGTQTLSGINTYTNNTRVVRGVLALEDSGSIHTTPAILVHAGATFDVSRSTSGLILNAGQTLSGGGVVTGSVIAVSGSWIEAGKGGSTIRAGCGAGTPTLANDLILNGYVTGVFILNPPPTNALITVAGNLTITGTNRVLIGHETLPPGRYTLLRFGGTLTGSAAENLALFCFPPGSRQTAVLDDSIPGEIALLVDGEAGDLIWAGDGVSNKWDLVSTNWLRGASPDRFYTGDAVTFNDSGSPTPAVNLVSNLAPSSILVNAVSNYTFAGSGSLSTTTLVKTNTGTLVLANGGTNAILQLQVDGGTVQVGNGGTNGSLGSVTVYNNGSLVFNRSDIMVWDKPIVGTGSVVQAGSGTLLLSATNTYTGPTSISNGVLAVCGALLGGGTVTVQDSATLIVGNLGSDGLDGVISGPVAVQAGGKLGGNGTIQGPVTVQAAGTLSPDPCPCAIWELGTGRSLTISNTLSLAGTTTLRLNKAAGTNDQVRGITTLTYGGTLLLTNVAGTLAPGDSFKLFDAANYTNFFSAISPATPGIGIGWDLQRLVVDGTLRVEATTMSYTNTIPAGVSLLANQLNAPGGNAVDHVFPNPIDGCMIWKWDCATQDWLVAAQYDSGFGGWVDESYNPLDPATVTLNPGQGFLFFNPGAATPVIFSGTTPTPVLPLPLPCGRGKFSAVACQSPATATWGTIIGIEPEEGDILERFHVPSQTYLTNLFTGGQWVPTNPVVNIGEGVLVRLPSIPAGDKYKANNALALNQAASWTNNAAPGAREYGVWSSIVTGPITNDLGTDMTWGGIKILDPGGPVTLVPTSNTLTLSGVSGPDIDLSTATENLTINCGLNLNSNQTWKVQSGRQLAVNGPIASSGTLTLDGGGAVLLAGTNNISGSTTVSNGVLALSGSLLGGGPVTIKAGGTLSLIVSNLGIPGMDGVISGPVTAEAGASLIVENLGIPGMDGVISGPVTIQAGANLAFNPCCPIGIGGQDGVALTVNSPLSLAGTVQMRVSRTNTLNSDRVVGITTATYGGTLVVTNTGPALQPGDSFKLFDAANYTNSFAAISPLTPGIGILWDMSYLPVDGTLRIKASVATNPINLTASVISGNTLQLAWPADHIGWTLESQTNSVSVGLGTNWLPVPESTLTNQMTMPITPANGSVFYRLKYAP